jgi:hypothetical protein
MDSVSATSSHGRHGAGRAHEGRREAPRETRGDDAAAQAKSEALRQKAVGEKPKAVAGRGSGHKIDIQV